MKTRIAIALALGLLSAATGCGDKRRALTAAEVKALFAGKTVVGFHQKHGYAFRSYYEPAGTFRSHQTGAGRAEAKPRQGRWWVEGSGRICVRWADGARDLCRTMVTDGKGHYWKILIKGNGKRIPIVRFESFTAGNAQKL